MRIAKAVEAELAPDGLGVYQLNRSAAGQTVFHYHMHLIPRSANQSADIHAKQQGDPEELSRLAQQLQAAISG